MNNYTLNISLRSKFMLLVLCLLVSGHVSGYAQSGSLPYNELKLEDLKSFRPATPNWTIAGDVFMDLYKPNDVQAAKGTGVLVNTNRGDKPQDIYTAWEHGDLDLELEFMMARGSNSGIYLQGRYELQLLDSWGVQNPTFADLGGIYERWEDGKGVGGIAPRVNAARAPGLWQHLEVKFRAPRFNEKGEKISNARLEEVILNGVMIHENVELTHPTGGAVSNKEAEKGPLRFQGDHGPVAFRNIKYKAYEHAPLTIQDISYRYFEGEFERTTDFGKENPAAEGSISELSLEPLASTEKFAIIYEGKLPVKEAGRYLFELRTDGGGRLVIDGKTVIENDVNYGWWDSKTAEVTLSKGSHDVELLYFRGNAGRRPALSIIAEGPGIEKHTLHATSAFPVNYQRIPNIVNPDVEPLLMHGFMDMDDGVHTHSVAVGYPGGVNYAFDLNNGSLLKFWKGEFLNLTPMWEGRGGSNLTLAVDEAAAITLSGAPSLAFLENDDTPWPDSLQNDVPYTFKNYRFEKNGDIVFTYQLGDVSIVDRIVPANESRLLSRTLTFESPGSESSLYARIIKGKQISTLPNGLFQVDDKTFYISTDGENAGHPRIRSAGNGQELIIPVSADKRSVLNYSIIW